MNDCIEKNLKSIWTLLQPADEKFLPFVICTPKVHIGKIGTVQRRPAMSLRKADTLGREAFQIFN